MTASVVFSPDGKTLAGASGDETVRLWDVATHAPIATLTGHYDLVESVVLARTAVPVHGVQEADERLMAVAGHVEQPDAFNRILMDWPDVHRKLT